MKRSERLVNNCLACMMIVRRKVTFSFVTHLYHIDFQDFCQLLSILEQSKRQDGFDGIEYKLARTVKPCQIFGLHISTRHAFHLKLPES